MQGCLLCLQWLNSAGSRRIGDPAPLILDPPPTVPDPPHQISDPPRILPPSTAYGRAGVLHAPGSAVPDAMHSYNWRSATFAQVI